MVTLHVSRFALREEQRNQCKEYNDRAHNAEDPLNDHEDDSPLNLIIDRSPDRYDGVLQRVNLQEVRRRVVVLIINYALALSTFQTVYHARSVCEIY